MGFKCGIVGLPNVGKSTLFNALTQMNVDAENYPFCTIDPNVGTVPVPDARLYEIAKIAKSKETVPTVIEFVDIAGLVEGASKGQGLGNRFLDHIRQTHTIAQVVRCFEDSEVTHVEGKISPLADIETINTELLLADLEVVERAVERVAKVAKTGEKKAVARHHTIKHLFDKLGEGTAVRDIELDEEQRAIARELNLITLKQMIILANTSEDADADAERVQQVRQYVEENDLEMVTICAKFEAELQGLNAEERAMFLEETGQSAGLDRVIEAGYHALNLLTFFTAGPKESRAWTTQVGSFAPQAAGRIHSDFERGFIRAEVISYEDYIACDGENAARNAGKLHVEGKDYVVCEGDVMHFRFNV